MHPLLSIFIMLVCAIGLSWLALVVYGLARKDKKTISRRSRIRLTEDGTGADDGGGGAH